jgi:hypothetical protein
MANKAKIGLIDVIKKELKKTLSYGVLGKKGYDSYGYGINEEEGKIIVTILTVQDNKIMNRVKTSYSNRTEASQAIKDFGNKLKEEEKELDKVSESVIV